MKTEQAHHWCDFPVCLQGRMTHSPGLTSLRWRRKLLWVFSGSFVSNQSRCRIWNLVTRYQWLSLLCLLPSSQLPWEARRQGDVGLWQVSAVGLHALDWEAQLCTCCMQWWEHGLFSACASGQANAWPRLALNTTESFHRWRAHDFTLQNHQTMLPEEKSPKSVISPKAEFNSLSPPLCGPSMPCD